MYWKQEWAAVAVAKIMLSMLVFWVVMLCGLADNMILEKHWYLPTSPHSITTQKITLTSSLL
jgi:hypothetical protein